MPDRVALRAGILAAAAIVLVLGAVLLPIGEGTRALLEWTSDRGAWTAVLLGAVWLPAALLLVPGSALTLGTGFLLGLGWGLPVVSAGSTLGATAAFLAGRRLGRDWVRDRIGTRDTFVGVDQAIEREGLKVVLLLRLSPLVPYNALNYALSLTGVGLRDYVVGSWLGMLPGTLLYVWLGAGARSLAAVVSGSYDRPTGWLILFAAGILATALVVVLITRAARRALAAGADPE